jgi:hypothetical protein
MSLVEVFEVAVLYHLRLGSFNGSAVAGGGLSQHRVTAIEHPLVALVGPLRHLEVDQLRCPRVRRTPPHPPDFIDAHREGSSVGTSRT